MTDSVASSVKSTIARARTVTGFPLSIVGESRYVMNFIAVFGERKEDGIDWEIEASLEYKGDNHYDPLAVVKIGAASSAVSLASTPASIEKGGALPLRAQCLVCAAHVRGGWDRGCGYTGDFGVTLALDIERPIE